MTDTIFASYKGFGISFPIKMTMEKMFDFLDDVAKEQEALITLHAQKTFYNALKDASGVNRPTIHIIAQVAEVFELDVNQFITLWFSNIKTLLKKGVIKQDDKNGFIIVSSKSKEEKLMKILLLKVCVVCKKESKHKCSKCGSVRYCCKEHQVENWKEHKKYCGKL